MGEAKEITVQGKLCLGIDPGSRGGFALVDLHNPHQVWLSAYSDILTEGVPAIVEQYRANIVVAAIERANCVAFGRSRAWSAGVYFGLWVGLVRAYQVPLYGVLPRDWQDQYFNVDYNRKQYSGTHSQKKRWNRKDIKAHSCRSANAIFDSEIREKDHDRADALHIALAARGQFLGEFTKGVPL